MPVRQISHNQWLECLRYELYHRPMPCEEVHRQPHDESMGEE